MRALPGGWVAGRLMGMYDRLPRTFVGTGSLADSLVSRGCLPLLLLLGVAGCASGPALSGDIAQQDMLALLMPSRIEIVEPFTRLRSFDADDIPDGIEVLLRAVNSLDNPGLMIVGSVRVELFEHVPASANQKGKRVEQWTVDLGSVSQQRKHWNRLTQMYEFRLGVNRASIPGVGRYVLSVTYTSPLSEHLTDEFVMEELRGMPGS